MIANQTIGVEAKSRLELRLLAHKIREVLGLEPSKPFPAVNVLEILPIFVPEAYFEVVPIEDMPINVHADTDVINKVIRIREDVYEGACKGNGRDRMTITHEFAHLIMICFYGFKLSRSFCSAKMITYCDPEWQAKCLAGELMMDSRAIINMPSRAIADKFGVSIDAAKLQLKKV